MKEEFDICAYCCEWVNSHFVAGLVLPRRVCDDYPEMMRKVLKHKFGMRKKAANRFIEEACDGNWDRLHETRFESKGTASDYAEMLLDDIFYCSDRWTWDRVLRVQWLYRRLAERVGGE